MMNLQAAVLLWFLLYLFSPIATSSMTDETRASNFLIISDIHLDSTAIRKMDISPSYANILNDLDSSSFDELITTIQHGIAKGTIAKPKYIIILGDLVGHLVFLSKTRIESESSVFKALKKHFPTTPIFYTFGNNDSLQSDYGPFVDPKQNGSLKSPYDIATKTADWGDGFLSTGVTCQTAHPIYPCISLENIIHGYYSAYLEPKLQLISINSVMFSLHRANVTEQEAMVQLKWLEAVLTKARNNHDNVILTMHIPPGNNIYNNANFWTPKESEVFINLIDKFHDIILGILASHTHAEELKIIRNKTGQKIAGVYLTAALSTNHGNAPSVKTFFMANHENQWQLVNYEAFYFYKNKSSLMLNKLYNYEDYYCNHKNTSLFQCLDQVTTHKMQHYFSAGNPNYPGAFNYPNDMTITH